MDHTAIKELIDMLESCDPAAAPDLADQLASELTHILDPEVSD